MCFSVVIGYNHSNTTASPEDYQGVQISFTLTALNNPQCVEVFITSDNIVDCLQYFSFFVQSAGPGIVMVIPDALNITIEDATGNCLPPTGHALTAATISPAEPTLHFTNDTTEIINEGDGSIRLCATITVTGVLECDYDAPLTIDTDGLSCKCIVCP